jgi:DNA-binding NarL/FixJ family response regulator
VFPALLGSVAPSAAAADAPPDDASGDLLARVLATTPGAEPAHGARRARAVSTRLPAVDVRLESQGGVTRLAGDGRALLAALRAADPDVVVLSNALSDHEGVRVLRALRAAGCRAAVTFERRRGTRARATPPLVAVVEPREGGWVPPADEPGPTPAAPDADAPLRARYGLSARELVVARLVATGHTNREIATLLDLSPFTARNHTSRVLRKLGAKNRARVAAMLG